MAWEHFTAPLAEGELFTPAMRAELVAALDERLKAVDASWGVDAATEAAIAASGLSTLRVHYTGPLTSGGVQASEFDTVINRLMPYYYRPDYIEDATTDAAALDAWDYAATELGLSAAELAAARAIGAPRLLEMRSRWNIYREAIRAMRWVDVYAAGLDTGYVDYFRQTFGDPTLPAAKAAFAAAPEPGGSAGSRLSTIGVYYRSNGPNHKLAGLRSEQTFALPAFYSAGWQVAATGSGGSVPFFVISEDDDEYIRLTSTLSFGALSLSVQAPITPADGSLSPWVTAAGSSTATGAIAAELLVDGYAGGDFADDIAAVWNWPQNGAPPEESQYGQGSCELSLSKVAIRPTFTHP